MNCGAQVPQDVNVRERDDYSEYRCPDCGYTIAERIVATNGNTATSPRRSPIGAREYTVDPDVDWDTWEVWWTNREVAVIIHGVLVNRNNAPEHILDFISQLESKV